MKSKIKPYRSVRFNDERKWKSKHPFDDVLQVGLQKAIGYVPWPPGNESAEIKNLICSMINSDKLICLLKSNSKKYMSFPCLYVGDEHLIQSILNNNKKVLLKAKWPIDAESVFFKICQLDDVDHKKDPKLYHLICELFNSWCLWCEKPIWKAGFNEPFSQNPYDPDAV